MTADTSDQAQSAPPAPSPAQDLAVGLFFAVFCAVGWYSLLSGETLMASLGAGLDPGPAFLPMLVLGLLSLGAALILIKGFYRLAKSRDRDENRRPISSPGMHGYAMAVLVTLALLPSVMGWLGFVPAAFLFVFPWIAWLAWQRTRRPWRSLLAGLLYAALISAFLYLVFVKALKVPLG